MTERTYEFQGETIRLVDRPNQFVLMKFAKASTMKVGGGKEMVASLTSVYDMVTKCIHKDDRERFEVLASEAEEGADMADLMEIVKATVQGAAERPTALPSDSSDGQSSMPLKSVPSSGVKVSELDLEAELPGRPDLQLAVRRQRSA